MNASAASPLLGLLVLLLLPGLWDCRVSLKVLPNRQQFYENSKLSLSCEEDGKMLEKWVIWRETKPGLKKCGEGQNAFGYLRNSRCELDGLGSATDSGVYWCEVSPHKRSLNISLTVTANNVLLKIPALPVPAGSNVTLECVDKNDKLQNYAKMFKDGKDIGGSKHVIVAVQKSNEGLYSCVFQGESIRSRLMVEGTGGDDSSSSYTLPPSTSLPSLFSPSTPTDSGSLLPTVLIAAVLGLLLVLTVLLLLLWGMKNKGRKDASPPADITNLSVNVPPGAKQKAKRPNETETVYSHMATSYAGQLERHTDDDVTYSEVAIMGSRSPDVIHGQLDDAQVVYASLKTGPSGSAAY